MASCRQTYKANEIKQWTIVSIIIPDELPSFNRVRNISVSVYLVHWHKINRMQYGRQVWSTPSPVQADWGDRFDMGYMYLSAYRTTMYIILRHLHGKPLTWSSIAYITVVLQYLGCQLPGRCNLLMLYNSYNLYHCLVHAQYVTVQCTGVNQYRCIFRTRASIKE